MKYTDQELIRIVIENRYFKNYSEMARKYYRAPSQFQRIANGEQKIGNNMIRNELIYIIKHAIPDGNGDGTCLECGQPTESEVYGYYGNRHARFYCRQHLQEYYAKGGR